MPDSVAVESVELNLWDDFSLSRLDTIHFGANWFTRSVLISWPNGS